MVRKFSGDVWTTNGDVQQASLRTDNVLMPGNTIRTGRNRQVLLYRGEETIMIAPNSVIGLPAEKKDGLATTIKQQTGSILLDVGKKNVQHFEVETPYLAAVVKSTHFRVTVSESGETFDVIRGQVEVADFKTGQIAQVMPGQHAAAFSNSNAGLSLGGTGALQPIQNGQPRALTIDRLPIPRNGLTDPVKACPASTQQRHTSGTARPGAVRISSALGEVRLNVHRATHGLARSADTAVGTRNAHNREGSIVWASGDSSGGVASGSAAGENEICNGGSGGNGNGNGGPAASGSSGQGGVANAVGGAAAGVVGGAGGLVGGVVAGVGGAVAGAGGGAGGVVGGVVGDAGGVVAGVGGAVRGTVGFLRGR